MYVSRGRSYYSSDGSQHSGRAPFLLLANSFDKAPCVDPGCGMAFMSHSHTTIGQLYGCVRIVALRQMGHFMMGAARIAGETIIVSGAYGSDGLPMNYDELSPRVRAQFRPVPDAIAEAYWHPSSPGWNNAGSEAPTMASWARAEFLGAPERSRTEARRG